MDKDPIIIPKAWRSQLPTLLFALVSGVLCSLVYRMAVADPVTFSVLWSELGFGIKTWWILWLVPIGALARATYAKFNVRYALDHHAIEMRSGRLAWNMLITRIRYQDIRSIETKQSVLDQLLGIGRVEIGTAASAGTEIALSGIENPRKVQTAIQEERSLLDRADKKGA